MVEGEADNSNVHERGLKRWLVPRSAFVGNGVTELLPGNADISLAAEGTADKDGESAFSLVLRQS